MVGPLQYEVLSAKCLNITIENEIVNIFVPSEANLTAVSIKQTTSAQTSAKWLPKGKSLPCISPFVFIKHAWQNTHAIVKLPCRFFVRSVFSYAMHSFLFFHHAPRVGGCNFFKLLRDIMIFVGRKSPEKRIIVFGILRGIENSTIFIDFYCLRLSFLLYSNQRRNLVTQSVFVTQSLAWDCSVEWLRQSQREPELLVCSSAVKIFKWKRETSFFFQCFWKNICWMGRRDFELWCDIQLLQTDPHTIS